MHIVLSAIWKYCWHIIGKAGGSILNKQCYPISQKKKKWHTDHSVRGQNWFFFSSPLSLALPLSLRCDIWTDCVSAWGEWRQEPSINHSVTLLLHYPKTRFLPSSLCLSSKLHNPCQSRLDCRLKVIPEREGGREAGRDGEEKHNRKESGCVTAKAIILSTRTSCVC